MSDERLTTLKFVTRTGEEVEMPVAELISVDGHPYKSYTEESEGLQSLQLAVIHLDGRVDELTSLVHSLLSPTE